MEKKLWEQIQKNQDVRQNLSKLRQLLREKGTGEAFGRWLSSAADVSDEKNAESASGEKTALGAADKKAAKQPGIIPYDASATEQLLIDLLRHPDAKTRKNAALLMGEFKNPIFREPLFLAYEAEEQLFVKSAYLNALQSFDCGVYMEKFKRRFEELARTEAEESSRKHRDEELRELSALLRGKEEPGKHTFCGLREPAQMVLLTSPACAGETAAQVEELEPEARVQVLKAGVLVEAGNVHWRNRVRTYRELLFRVKGMELCPAEPEAAAEIVASSELPGFLGSCHKGNPPFYFRIEVRSQAEPEKKAAFAKKMAVGIERLTNRKLVNAVSDYELSIRLIENKKGSYTALVKLFTLEDGRFSYRREVMPESIKPVNAAAAAALAKDYLKEDAQVLDPFCGVGTMLVERHKAVRANTSYGIDYKAEAIEKAKANTAAAGQVIHYIQKDFFAFEHEYLFDEIFTDMPFALGRKAQEEIEETYRRFFPAAYRVLKADGTAVLYTRDRKYVKQMAALGGFALIKETEFSRKDGVWLMILKKRARG